jgi:hypothetical protein
MIGSSTATGERSRTDRRTRPNLTLRREQPYTAFVFFINFVSEIHARNGIFV